jgi:hypothetical protein
LIERFDQKNANIIFDDKRLFLCVRYPFWEWSSKRLYYYNARQYENLF